MKKSKTTKKNLMHEVVANDQENSAMEIISALEYLKEEAVRCEAEDLHTVLDLAFKLCLCVYTFQIRREYPLEKGASLN